MVGHPKVEFVKYHYMPALADNDGSMSTRPARLGLTLYVPKGVKPEATRDLSLSGARHSSQH